MTVAQKIKQRIDKLEQEQQAALLSFLESIEPERKPKSRPRRKTRSQKQELAAALRGVAGIWKDRTDLPKDSGEASRQLRRRLMRRSGNA